MSAALHCVTHFHHSVASLIIGDGQRVAPESIVVQAMDRYPRRGKGWHWRIALAVHFPDGRLRRRDHRHGRQSLQETRH